MQNQPIDRIHRVLDQVLVPEPTRRRLETALADAAARGFHIDVEQLRANLSRLAQGELSRQH